MSGEYVAKVPRRDRAETFRHPFGLAPRHNCPVPHFLLTTEIDAEPAEVFELALSVDAHTASMGRSGERAVAGVTSGRLQLGDTVTWKARHFGFPFRMTSVISSWDPPRSFVDEQTQGPFAAWRRVHRFEPAGEGRTRMVAVVVFSSPLGALGGTGRCPGPLPTATCAGSSSSAMRGYVRRFRQVEPLGSAWGARVTGAGERARGSARDARGQSLRVSPAWRNASSHRDSVVHPDRSP